MGINFSVSSRLFSLHPESEMCIIFSNIILPSSYDGQEKAMKIACAIFVTSTDSLTSDSEICSVPDAEAFH